MAGAKCSIVNLRGRIGDRKRVKGWRKAHDKQQVKLNNLILEYSQPFVTATLLMESNFSQKAEEEKEAHRYFRSTAFCHEENKAAFRRNTG